MKQIYPTKINTVKDLKNFLNKVNDLDELKIDLGLETDAEPMYIERNAFGVLIVQAESNILIVD